VLKPEDLVAHAGFVRAVARRIVADAAGADDVAQDTFVAALERPPRRPSNLRGWLGAVVRNVARFAARGERRRRGRERAAAGLRAGTAPSALDVAEQLEWQRRVVDAVAALPEPLRATVLLRYFEGHAATEIARRHGVTEVTVRNRIRAAFVLLRRRLRERHGSASLLALSILAHPPAKSATAAAKTGALLMAHKSVLLPAILIVGVGATVAVRGGAQEEVPPARAPFPPPVEARDEASAPPAGPAAKEAGPAPSDPVEDYLRRVNEAEDLNAVIAIGEELARLAPRRGYDLLATLHARVGEARRRRALHTGFWTFVDGRAHPCLMDAVHLLATDRDEGSRVVAFGYLRHYAFADYRDDPSGYEAWRRLLRQGSLADAVRLSAAGLVLRVADMEPAAAFEELLRISPPDRRFGGGIGLDIAAAFRDAGFLRLAASRIVPPENPRPRTEEEWAALRAPEPLWRWIEAVEPDAAFLRECPRRAAEGPETWGPVHADAAICLLGRSRAPWAFDLLAPLLVREPHRECAATMAQALARLGGQRAIPYLVAAIAEVDDAGYTERICGGALSKLARVSHTQPKSAAWWLVWWDENRHRLPREAQEPDPRAIRFAR
jgi:RNA polymerase sigma factor (sigma-70 family)